MLFSASINTYVPVNTAVLVYDKNIIMQIFTKFLT